MYSKVLCRSPPPEPDLNPNHIILTVKSRRPKIIKPILVHRDPKEKKSIQKIRKEGHHRIHRVPLKSKNPQDLLKTSEIRTLTASLKWLDHLKYLEIDIYSLPSQTYSRAMAGLFGSLKHFKTPLQIHFFFSQIKFSQLDRKLLILSKVIDNFRSMPHI